MSTPIVAVAIDSSTQLVDFAGELTADEAMRLLSAGLVIVPITKELHENQLRQVVQGTHIPKPYALPDGRVTPYRSALANIAQALGMDENETDYRLCRAIQLLQAQLAAPVDVVLHCPACKAQHIDTSEPPEWLNRPHHTHKCHSCGELWTASARATNGVLAFKPGKSATWPRADAALFAPERLPARDAQGFTWHPDVPDMGEDEDITPYLSVIGHEGVFVSMEGDAPAALWDKYSEGMDGNCLDWTPTTPEGGYRLGAIYDTEDGPYAMVVRPIAHLVRPA